MSKTPEAVGQCWGCEHRVKAHRAGRGPRCECTTFGSATCGCYMYSPAPPLIERRGAWELKLHGRKRPLYSGILGARKVARHADPDELHKLTIHLSRPQEVIQLWIPTPKLLRRMRGNFAKLDQLIDQVEGGRHGR